jgi:hypothetical protein
MAEYETVFRKTEVTVKESVQSIYVPEKLYLLVVRRTDKLGGEDVVTYIVTDIDFDERGITLPEHEEIEYIYEYNVGNHNPGWSFNRHYGQMRPTEILTGEPR